MSTHERLDEMELVHGWRRGMTTDLGTIATDKEAQSTVDGRTVRLLCYYDRNESLVWDVGALWKTKTTRRQRKALRKDKGELAQSYMDSAMQAVLQGSSDGSDDESVHESVVVATGGVFYPGTGDPPPSSRVVAISVQLAAFATRVEDHLKTQN